MPRNRRDCSHYNPRIPHYSSVIDNDHRRDAHERPVVALLFPRLEINAARAARRRGNYHLGQNFARFEQLLARDRAFTRRTGEPDARVERHQRRGKIRRMHDKRRAAAEDRMVAVKSADRVTFVAALLEALDILIAEIPASRTLQQITAYGGEVSNLRRRRFFRSHRNRFVALAYGRVIRDVVKLPERANLEPAVRGRLDSVHPRESLEIDEAFRRDHVLLHQVDEIDTACERNASALGEQAARVSKVNGGEHFEAIHHAFPRAASTLSGVIGNARTGTPIAS